jgi:hypothetical protein
MNWVLISLCFLTGCVIGLFWIFFGLVRTMVYMRAQHEADMVMVRKMMEAVQEHQLNIIKTSQESFQQIADNQLKLTRLVSFLAGPEEKTNE